MLGLLESLAAVPHPANGETPLLHYGRWTKLKREFYKAKKGVFDTTKIPDLYDNAMYDMLHNQQLELPALPELYATARALASYVVPQEYGLEPEDKVKIGSAIGSSMLNKLRRDLLTPMEQDRGTGAHADVEQERVHRLDHSVHTDVRTPHRHVRTRLYFTSESHIHSLFNVLRWGVGGARSPSGSMSAGAAANVPNTMFSEEAHAMYSNVELGYLTQIVLRVTHKTSVPLVHEPASYYVQVLVSPGIDHHEDVCEHAVEKDSWQHGSAASAAAPSSLHESLKVTEGLVLASTAAALVFYARVAALESRKDAHQRQQRQQHEEDMEEEEEEEEEQQQLETKKVA